MTNGQKVGILIHEYLKQQKLTTAQKLSLEECTTGSHEPDSLDDILDEVDGFMQHDNIAELVKLYMLLPKVKDKGVQFFLHGGEISRTQFFAMGENDRANLGNVEIRNDKGSDGAWRQSLRHPVYENPNNPLYNPKMVLGLN